MSSEPTAHRESDSRKLAKPSKEYVPKLSITGLGYEYVRCQRGEYDDTVYIHQLCAIAAGADPYDVFDPKYEIEHLCPIPWLNTPENVELVPNWKKHRLPRYIDIPTSQVVDFEPVADFEGDSESTVYGVPLSEFDQLDEADVKGGSSACSRNLQRHMERYRNRDLRGGEVGD